MNKKIKCNIFLLLLENFNIYTKISLLNEERLYMNRFQDKIVLITGGTSGMGKVTANFFLNEGAIVCISGRNVENGYETVDILGKIGEIFFIKCDITSISEVKDMLLNIVNKYKLINIAVNNAGITCEKSLMHESNEENWINVINTNLIGTYLCMKYETQIMLENDGGSIVNNSSVVGLVPVPRMSSYIASKLGICGLTRAAAIEYANTKPMIRINAIAPGPVLEGMNSLEKLNSDPVRANEKINMIAMGRMGKPEEIANLILWLCSDEATYITGTIIPIDGGFQSGKW